MFAACDTLLAAAPTASTKMELRHTLMSSSDQPLLTRELIAASTTIPLAVIDANGVPFALQPLVSGLGASMTGAHLSEYTIKMRAALNASVPLDPSVFCAICARKAASLGSHYDITTLRHARSLVEQSNGAYLLQGLAAPTPDGKAGRTYDSRGPAAERATLESI